MDAMQIKESRFRALSNIFTRVDRVLSNRDVLVSLDEHAPAGVGAISWTDGKNIWINKNEMPNPVSPEAVVKITGANYHELCHVLMTPRSHTDVVRRAANAGMFGSFNMLEDMRIESFFVARYPKAAHYFTAMVLEWLAKPEHAGSAYPLMYGRQYLPGQVIATFRAVYQNQRHLSEIEKVIDDYKTVVFHRDDDRALELITKFHNLIAQVAPPTDHDGGCGTSHSTPISNGAPDIDAQEEGAEDVMDGKDKEAGEEAREEGAGDGSGDEGDEEGDGEGGGSGTGDSGEDADGEEAPGRGGTAEDDSDDDDGDDDGSGDGGGYSPTGSGSVQDAIDAARDAIEQSLDSQTVKDDVQQVQAAALPGEVITPNDLDKWEQVRVTACEPDMVNMARRVHKEFRQLKEEADPQWSRNRRRGVLDARVASNPKSDPREVFREWEDGQDDIADLEVVILMDISSSMNSGMGQMYGIPAGRAERRCYVASKALWILRTALDKLDASTTVLGFNGYGVRIYDRDERTGRTAFKSVSVSGGTHPDEALRAAKNVLDSSKRAHKVLIILSDGQWYSSDGDDMTEQLSKDGVTTALFGIGYDPAGDLHGTNHAAEVMDLDGIVAAVKSTVKVAMRKKVRR